jgi:hypothetical protein
MRIWAMTPLDVCLETLVPLAKADDPAGILTVHEAIDRLLDATGPSPSARIAILRELGQAFENRAPRTDLAIYARLVMEQRRRLVGLELQPQRNLVRD